MYKSINDILNTIVQGNCLSVLKEFPSESVDCVFTSPPYWSLRKYLESEDIWDGDSNCVHEWEEKIIKHGTDASKVGGFQGKSFKKNQEKSNASTPITQQGKCKKCGAWRGGLGLEPDFLDFINHLCDIFDEVRRVLKKTGSCYVNLGDTYYTKSAGNFQSSNIMSVDKINEMGLSDAQSIRGQKRSDMRDKSLVMIPFRFAIEMVNRGWILRNSIIWYKPNCLVTSARDRFTQDFEHIFFFTKSRKYYFKLQYEQGNDGNLRRKRCVWKVNTAISRDSHYAQYPPDLINIPIKSSCPENGIVLDPFMGAGSTAIEVEKQGKNWVGIDMSSEYIDIAMKRIKKERNNNPEKKVDLF